jgi:hypothetical protein
MRVPKEMMGRQVVADRSEEVVGQIQVFGLGPRHCAVIRVPNMMCLTSYALALVLVACVKVRKAK